MDSSKSDFGEYSLLETNFNSERVIPDVSIMLTLTSSDSLELNHSTSYCITVGSSNDVLYYVFVVLVLRYAEAARHELVPYYFQVHDVNFCRYFWLSFRFPSTYLVGEWFDLYLASSIFLSRKKNLVTGQLGMSQTSRPKQTFPTQIDLARGGGVPGQAHKIECLKHDKPYLAALPLTYIHTQCPPWWRNEPKKNLKEVTLVKFQTDRSFILVNR